MGLLTLIGQSISVASLLLTMILFYAVRNKRIVYRTNSQFHLIGALLGYNFIFMLHEHLKASLCKLTAILLHFFLLSSFTWAFRIAFRVFKGLVDLKRILAPPAVVPGLANKKWIPTVVSWGIPLFAVVVCATIDANQPGLIGYGVDEQVCWIGSAPARLAIFAWPTLTVLMMNVIMFAGSICIIASLRGVPRFANNVQFIKVESIFSMISRADMQNGKTKVYTHLKNIMY